MKKLLAVAIILIIFSSCAQEDGCGIVTDYGFNEYGYYVELDGDRYDVSYAIFNEARLGEQRCIY